MKAWILRLLSKLKFWKRVDIELEAYKQAERSGEWRRYDSTD